MTHSLVRAAQYLRMSTEHQQYSLANQADAISRYATDHGFTIVRTYSDPARSGLTLKKRHGLKQLLADVVAGDLAYRAVLVYDVSRWGRFQDTDEAAHYEYLCKSSGVPIYYCAEMFSNDNSMATLIMKALKRGMAGEYSRELSVKVRGGLVRLTGMGYKAGGSPAYGLRRMLLDSAGRKKQLLVKGERKSIVTDRVILVPGPSEEVKIVQRIFHEFVFDGRSLSAIARGLNRDGIAYRSGAMWSASDILRILRNDHYAGRQAWGKRRAFLGEGAHRVPAEEWVIRDHAFEPIVPTELFEKARASFSNFTHNLSNEQLLERLRKLWRAKGKLSSSTINRDRQCPCASTYRMRFGGLLQVYEKLGYPPPKFTCAIGFREFTLAIRNKLIADCVEHSNGQLQSVRKNQKFRPLLRERGSGTLFSVLVAKSRLNCRGERSWNVCPLRKEAATYSILVLLNLENNAPGSMYVLPKLEGRKPSVLWQRQVLGSGIELKHPGELLRVARQIPVTQTTVNSG